MSASRENLLSVLLYLSSIKMDIVFFRAKHAPRELAARESPTCAVAHAISNPKSISYSKGESQ